jgi:hypothetical protein
VLAAVLAERREQKRLIRPIHLNRWSK